MVKLYAYCRSCRRKSEIEINEKEDAMSLVNKSLMHGFRTDCGCRITLGYNPYSFLLHVLERFPDLVGIGKKFDSIEKIFPVYYQKTFEEIQKQEEEDNKRISLEIEEKIKQLTEQLKRYKKT